MMKIPPSKTKETSIGLSQQRCLFAIVLSALIMPLTTHADDDPRQAYEKALQANWQETFHDDGTNDWQDKWFLDGLKATVNNDEEGMYYSAGPIARDDASHAVLWTQQSFSGDVKLEFSFTRFDTINKWVCIVYLQATGTGEAPYSKDIYQWRQLRDIPFMSSYFKHMNLLHVTFSAYNNVDGNHVDESYIRVRRYPSTLYNDGFKGMALTPDYLDTGLFHPGEPNHVTLIKKGDDLFMNVRQGNEEKLFHWDLSQKPPVTEGRIGLRHMYQRAGRYSNISICEIAP